MEIRENVCKKVLSHSLILKLHSIASHFYRLLYTQKRNSSEKGFFAVHPIPCNITNGKKWERPWNEANLDPSCHFGFTQTTILPNIPQYEFNRK